ncbi:hypothetical protein EDB80DRAFT_719144 [Ilyonectria destructans]|nr:hypothetical protein EDB80DRAFT_719144 [Ilyonectria destructans]
MNGRRLHYAMSAKCTSRLMCYLHIVRLLHALCVGCTQTDHIVRCADLTSLYGLNRSVSNLLHRISPFHHSTKVTIPAPWPSSPWLSSCNQPAKLGCSPAASLSH